jgi:hypothetical protein
MGAWLRLLLVAAHLGAIAFPCPEPALAEAAAERAPELHAFCHCGCDEAPPATRTASLAVALLPAATLPALPRAAHTEAPPLAPTSAPAHALEPVPRPA